MSYAPARGRTRVDARGVKRLVMTALDGSTWKIWRAPGEDWNGPDGPGFNEWEIDFPINYFRM
jgi:hypothetical protein